MTERKASPNFTDRLVANTIKKMQELFVLEGYNLFNDLFIQESKGKCFFLESDKVWELLKTKGFLKVLPIPEEYEQAFRDFELELEMGLPNSLLKTLKAFLTSGADPKNFLKWVWEDEYSEKDFTTVEGMKMIENHYSPLLSKEFEVSKEDETKNKKIKSEVKNMFTGNIFKGFSNVDTSRVKMTMLGLGVETERGEVFVFDRNTKELTDATDFVIDLGMDMVFVFPSSEIEVGDLIVHNQSVVFVTKTTKNQVMAIDFETQQEITILKKKHPLGFSFVPKIVAPMGNVFNGMLSPNGNGGLDSIMPMMMMSQMFGKEKGEKSFMGMMEMMMFSQMMGKGGNPFSQMFPTSQKTETETEE